MILSIFNHHRILNSRREELDTGSLAGPLFDPLPVPLSKEVFSIQAVLNLTFAGGVPVFKVIPTSATNKHIPVSASVLTLATKFVHLDLSIVHPGEQISCP